MSELRRKSPYYELSIQLFLAVTIGRYLYYEIEDGVSFVDYQSIKIFDKPLVAVLF
ncbi:MAG: hypothetical protein LBC04_02195 [Holosporaceae bacterium]|jgi:hypothetical protein|nr:hypothetical protein [Holosporaceae bacterium]